MGYFYPSVSSQILVFCSHIKGTYPLLESSALAERFRLSLVRALFMLTFLQNFAMAPKEYNLMLDSTFSCLGKEWEGFNEKFLTKLLDNSLEGISDYATLFFDGIQASQQPGGTVIVLSPDSPLTARPSSSSSTNPAATPVTARRLAPTSASGSAATDADDEDEDVPDTGVVALHPNMLNDPKY